MAIQSLPVDLADPREVQEKLPQIKALLEAKRVELKELTAQVHLLARLVGEAPLARERKTAARRAAGVSTRIRAHRASPAQDRAVEGLERAGEPMGPTALYDFMTVAGMDAPKSSDALGASLWAAANAGRIHKWPSGLYAPLGTPDPAS